jgi:exopolysaccharide biosynthesis polyprenyl glycosylphosphotransferase
MDRSLHPAAGSTLPSIFAYLSNRRNRWRTHLLLLFTDQVLIVVAFILAYWMRYHANWPAALSPIVSEVATQNLVQFTAFVPITLLLVSLLTILFEAKGLYRLPRGSSLIDHMGIIISSTLIGIALVIVVVFLYRPFYYSRLIFAFAGINIVLLLGIWRVLLHSIRNWCWSNGIGRQRVVVVGGTGLGQQVMNGIAAHPGMGFHLVGYLNERPIFQHTAGSRIYRHLGTLTELEDTVRRNAVHQAIIALPFWEQARLPEMVHLCRSLGVEYHIVPDLYQLSFERTDVLRIGGVPLLAPREPSLKGWNLALKRSIDIGLVLLASPLVLPLALLLALLIRLDSRGPAVFRQERIGKHGRPFTCYKFRTMVIDAEARKAELSQLNEADGPLFKIRNDPRVTRVGRFLRRSSLDELPQLWNVLRGEMSLVGPRPALPAEVACYEPWQRRRLEVMPGLTGLGQALGRSSITFDELVRLDIFYAENWSVSMDIRIMLMTIPAVISGRGAY